MQPRVTESQITGLLDQLVGDDVDALAEHGISVTGLRRMTQLRGGPTLVQSVLAHRTSYLPVKPVTAQNADQMMTERIVAALDRANAELAYPLLPLPGETPPLASAEDQERERATRAELASLTDAQRSILMVGKFKAASLEPMCDLPGGPAIVLGVLNCYLRPFSQPPTAEDRLNEKRARLVIAALDELEKVSSMSTMLGLDAPKKPKDVNVAVRPMTPKEIADQREYWEYRMTNPRTMALNWVTLGSVGAGAGLCAVLAGVISVTAVYLVFGFLCMMLFLSFVLTVPRRPPVTPWRRGFITLLYVGGCVATGGGCLASQSAGVGVAVFVVGLLLLLGTCAAGIRLSLSAMGRDT